MMRFQVFSSTTACLAVASFFACRSEAALDRPVEVRDSAGVQIVENGPISSDIAFRVGEPIYQTGWSPDGHLFQNVFSGVLLSNGRAAVGDIGNSELVILGASGAVEAVLGGEGQGPGEIGALISMARLGDDTIVVEDDGNARLSFFHGDSLIRSNRVESGRALFRLRSLGLEDNSLIMTISQYRLYFEEPWLRAPLVRHPLNTQQWDTVGLYDFAQRISQNVTPNPIRPSGHAAVTAGGMIVNRGDRSQVERMDLSGQTTQIILWEEDRRPLTASLWAIREEYWASRNTRRTEAELREFLADLRAAATEHLPYSGGLHGDDAGNVWVAEYSMDFPHPARYRVFGPDGHWLGWVEMPPRFQILDIGREFLLGIQRDEFDVQAITLVPIVR